MISPPALVPLGALMGAGLLVAAPLLSATAASPEEAPASPVRYSKDVRPILSETCFLCHGPDHTTREAGLRLDTFEEATRDLGGYAALVPGDPEASELWYRLNAEDHDELMPPTTAVAEPLDAEQLDVIRRWIEQGGEYERHWAFVPPVKQIHTSLAANPVDVHLDRALADAGVEPLAEAAPETLLRRLFLDLTGLPPTLDEQDAFLAEWALADSEADTDAVWRRWVDRIFDEEPYRTRHAERMTSVWLDRARYADTNGIHMDAGRQMWAWRDWVLAAYRDNMPFDRFLTEQLAGDLLPDATVDQLVASGFNRNHVITDEGGAINEEYLVEYMADRVQTTGAVFLGLTMQCARCHDHKFDPLTQEDYFRFGAFFNSIDEPGLYSQQPDPNRAMEPFIEVPSDEQVARRAELAAELAEVRASRMSPSEEERALLAEQRAALPGDLGLTWHAAPVVAMESAAGATLERQPDGSVLSSGPLEGLPGGMEVQTLTLHTVATDLRLLQLDALGHESMTGGAPGRSPNGNAVLTGIEVEAVSASDPTQRHPVELTWAWADHAQTNDDYGVLEAFDLRDNTGWAIAGHTDGNERGAMFLAAEPFGFEGGTEVVVTLRYESIWAGHSFGRVRLGLASMDAAALERMPVAGGAWYHAGPFGLPSATGAYDVSFGPATDTTLDPTKDWPAEGGPSQRWSYRMDFTDGVAHKLAGGTNVHYLGKELWSPTARDVEVSLGSDDGFALFVNGEEVAERQVARAVAPDQDRATIHLEPGRNTLVLEVTNTGGEAGFFVRLDQAEGVLVGDLVAMVYDQTHRAEPKPPVSGDATLPDSLDDRILHSWRLERSPEYAAALAREAQLVASSAELEAAIPRTMVMRERAEPRPAFLLMRGEYDKPDESWPVTPGVPGFLTTNGGELVPEGQRATRLDLAEWMTAPDNPLVPRVTVNRLWQLVFGRGLVSTPGDFGYQGAWPSNPELLDDLASSFVHGGWDRRELLTTLVTSRAYRRSSAIPDAVRAADPDGALYAGYPRRRLEAEVIRDQALYVSGLLVEELGGPSVKTYQPEGLWREVAMLQSNTRLFERGSGDELWRRSLYTYWKRAAPPPAMLTFDAPTRESCVVQRPITNTPLQALVLWNDEQFVEAARVLAERTWLAVSGDQAAGLAHMFRAATGRAPDAEEQQLLLEALFDLEARYADAPEEAAELVAVGEAPSAVAMSGLPDDVAPTDATLAAWTLVASAILNLHATITQG